MSQVYAVYTASASEIPVEGIRFVHYNHLSSGYAFLMNSRPWNEVAKAMALEKGITYQEIANAVGCTKGAVSHWFNAVNRPRIETIRKIAKVLGTTITELVQEDAYFLTDDTERELIDLLRSVKTDEQRKEFIRLASAFMASKQAD